MDKYEKQLTKMIVATELSLEKQNKEDLKEWQKGILQGLELALNVYLDKSSKEV